MSVLYRFWRDERGSTPIEYGIIGTLISIMCIGGATAIGVNIKSKWLGPLSNAFN
jgi:pilus assembly protein Flp/PilA